MKKIGSIFLFLLVVLAPISYADSNFSDNLNLINRSPILLVDFHWQNGIP